jgi:serine/threonine-protein phosphatase 6 regulatory ankyrin repeat subunit B
MNKLKTVSLLFLLCLLIFSCKRSIPPGADIFEAISAGDSELVGLMLEKNKAVAGETGRSQKTPLHYAIEYNQQPIIKLLIDYGADINARDIDGYTPLMYAAQTNDLVTGKLLLEKGADVNNAGLGGYTAIMLAAGENYVDFMKLLVAHGADINARTDSTRDENTGQLRGPELTALALAAKNNALEALDYLLALGAPIDGNETMFDPLGQAAENNALAAMELLLVRGARVDGRPGTTFSPLMFAASNNKNLEAARLLIEKGANVNFDSGDGYTALTLTYLRDADKIARLLLEHGANVNARYKLTGDTALLHAVKEGESGEEKVIDVLLEFKANVNIRDNDGHTALYYAKRAGKEALVQKLLQHGAVEK